MVFLLPLPTSSLSRSPAALLLLSSWFGRLAAWAVESALWAARRLSAPPASLVPTPLPSVSKSRLVATYTPVKDSGGGGGGGSGTADGSRYQLWRLRWVLLEVGQRSPLPQRSQAVCRAILASAGLPTADVRLGGCSCRGPGCPPVEAVFDRRGCWFGLRHAG